MEKCHPIISHKTIINGWALHAPGIGRYLTPDPISYVRVFYGISNINIFNNKLFYLNYHYYSKSINNVFVIPLLLKNPSTLNLFLYTPNNPLIYGDKCGLMRCPSGYESTIVFSATDLLACLGWESAALLTTGAACAVAIAASVPVFASILGAVSACGVTVTTLTGCVVGSLSEYCKPKKCK